MDSDSVVPDRGGDEPERVTRTRAPRLVTRMSASPLRGVLGGAKRRPPRQALRGVLGGAKRRPPRPVLRSLPWHVALLALWSALWYQALSRRGGLSWHFFSDGGRLLIGQHWDQFTAPGGLHVFASYPRLQFGPVTYAAGALMQFLGPDHGMVAAQVLMAGTGLALVYLLERTALRARPDVTADQMRLVTLGGGTAFLPIWMILSVRFAHLDDVLALTFATLAVWALVAGKGALTGVFLALSASSKPWALAFLPLLLAVPPGPRLRAAGWAAGLMALAWGPFVLADRDAFDVVGFSISNVPGSGLRALGLDNPTTPSWDRPAQLLVGGALAAAAAMRRRWPAVVILASAARVALDPNTYLYYAAGIVLGALMWDMLGARRPAPLWSLASVAVLVADTGMSQVPGFNGELRLSFVVIAALPMILGHAGAARTGFEPRHGAAVSTIQADPRANLIG